MRCESRRRCSRGGLRLCLREVRSVGRFQVRRTVRLKVDHLVHIARSESPARAPAPIRRPRWEAVASPPQPRVRGSTRGSRNRPIEVRLRRRHARPPSLGHERCLRSGPRRNHRHRSTTCDESAIANVLPYASLPRRCELSELATSDSSAATKRSHSSASSAEDSSPSGSTR